MRTTILATFCASASVSAVFFSINEFSNVQRQLAILAVLIVGIGVGMMIGGTVIGDALRKHQVEGEEKDEP